MINQGAGFIAIDCIDQQQKHITKNFSFDVDEHNKMHFQRHK